MDAFGWARNAADKLSAKFGDRLVFVGIQGSRARTKAELANQLDGDEARILEIGRDWQVCPPSDDGRRKQLIDLLLRWSEGILAR